MLVMPVETRIGEEPNKAQIFDKIFHKTDNLPTLPGIAVKLLEAVQREEPDIDEIGDLLSKDPPLCAKVLKLINSSYYGLTTRISSVHHALKLLGLISVQNLALSFSLLKSYSSNNSSKFDYVLFWKKSLTRAISAKLLAERLHPIISGDIFFLGLLQDIGILTLGHCFPRQYNLVENEAYRLGITFRESEDQILGYNHQDVGEYLTKSWGLPKSFYLPIGCHHQPEESSKFDSDTRVIIQILHLSSLYAEMYNGAANAENLWLIEKALQNFGFQDKFDLEEISNQLDHQIQQIFPHFELTVNFDQNSKILDKARAEQSKLSIEMIENMMKQKQEIESLKQMVVRDSMTQLYNHQYFREQLQKEILRAQRYSLPLSLIFADIDNFKAINDTFGHPVGDVVIKAVADSLQSALRDSDHVARYGGEEFAIILTETETEGAMEAGERLRNTVCSLNIQSSDKRIFTTMSFGITSLDLGKNSDMDELIRTADAALYQAKENGRNQCCLH